MSQLANTSATSLNFIGFEDVKGQGLPELIYNQVFIEPNQSYTAGVGQLAAAGFVPGTQSYLKRRSAGEAARLRGLRVRDRGQSETGGGVSSDLAWGQAAPRPTMQGDESAYTHADNRVARGFFP